MELCRTGELMNPRKVEDAGAPVTPSFLLQEDGFKILQEDGSGILLE